MDAKDLIDFCKGVGIGVVCMESCTGGALVSRLTDISGSSEVVKDSFVCYSNEAKEKLGVEGISEFGVYSLEVALDMSKKAIINSVGSNLVGIGITGSLGRKDPANEDSQTGEVFIGVSFGDKEFCEMLVVDGRMSRVESKKQIVDYVIDLVFNILTM